MKISEITKVFIESRERKGWVRVYGLSSQGGVYKYKYKWKYKWKYKYKDKCPAKAACRQGCSAYTKHYTRSHQSRNTNTNTSENTKKYKALGHTSGEIQKQLEKNHKKYTFSEGKVYSLKSNAVSHSLWSKCRFLCMQPRHLIVSNEHQIYVTAPDWKTANYVISMLGLVGAIAARYFHCSTTSQQELQP